VFHRVNLVCGWSDAADAGTAGTPEELSGNTRLFLGDASFFGFVPVGEKAHIRLCGCLSTAFPRPRRGPARTPTPTLRNIRPTRSRISRVLGARRTGPLRGYGVGGCRGVVYRPRGTRRRCRARQFAADGPRGGMAMEDASVLAEELRPAATIESGLRNDLHRRKPRVKWVQQQSIATAERFAHATCRPQRRVPRTGDQMMQSCFGPLIQAP
jgi:hypothetical protein